MDLDFSFTLVSSLTPRNKIVRPHSAKSEKLFKRKPTPSEITSIDFNSFKLKGSKPSQDKENLEMKTQIVVDSKKATVEGSEIIQSNEFQKSSKKRSSSFNISMRNIALRRNRTKEKNKYKTTPPKMCNSIDNTNWNISDSIEEKVKPDTSGASPDIINDSCENLNKSQHHSNLINGKSSRHNSLVSPPRSNVFIGSASLDTKPLTLCQSNRVTRLSKEKFNSSVSKRVSGESLSTSYGSDSLTTIQRPGTKVILETPDSDKSTSVGRKRKSSMESTPPSRGKNTSVESNSSLNKHLSDLNLGRGTIYFSTNDIFLETNCEPIFESELQPKKKLRSSNETNLLDQFNILSSIQSKSRKSTANDGDPKEEQATLSSHVIKKPSNSPKVKNPSSKETSDKKKDSLKVNEPLRKRNSTNTSSKKKNKENSKPTSKSVQTKRTTRRSSNLSPVTISSPKVELMPPVEVIPKFDHINKWLEDTCEKSVVLISSESSIENSALVPKPVRGRKAKVSLSPRIKKKLTVAQKTLEEEQKLFEELYGNDATKRLSDDVDEVVSLSSEEDAGVSENVLNKLYVSVRQRLDEELVTHSEPRQPRRKSSDKKKPAPSTDKKNPRMSIYDVFSSSSSEDRFEAFLESVKRGKQKTKKRTSNPRATMEFINDSSSESNCSATFYQNIVSSAVKEDVNKIRSKTKINTDLNRRRLSFSSSKDGHSEGGKSDTKPETKIRKPTTKERKKRSPKSKPTKKEIKQLGAADDKKDDSNIFSLVTPLKFKDKKKKDIINARLNGLRIECDEPRSVGKSKTPKNTQKSPRQPKTDEVLRKKYLGEEDFKVPKSKTPARPIPSKVPSSPALSFLSSLSEKTGGLPCHPEASVFKKEFKKRREELAKKLFSLYNKEVFDSKLPADMLIQWNVRMRSTSGFCYNKRIYRGNDVFRASRIVLSTKILDRPDRLRDTLIHELCHAATWIIDSISDGHGPSWKAWADKANRRFPELPRIKRCHDYAISTKYTYKCMTCGYCIGRHSKSLNTERKRCGYCMGRFEAFLTSKMASTAVSVSATSGSDSAKTGSTRAPTGFALFVKDNYATVKRENNNVPHAQVMKLLSQKFADVKISRQNKPD